MNIKNLRKSYENLTMFERLSLADNAISRDDESEIKAIIAASPRKHFSQVDYYDLMREITTFRLCNLIVRLSYIMQFDYFCQQIELDILKNKSSSKNEEGFLNAARMSAFLYCRAKDSWKAVNDDLGLRPNFDEEISEFLFAFDLMESKEKIMRKMAFTEDEVREHLKKNCDGGKVQTVEDEIKATREALELPTN